MFHFFSGFKIFETSFMSQMMEMNDEMNDDDDGNESATKGNKKLNWFKNPS